MTRQTKHGFLIQLQCTLGHVFMLQIEREDDLTESFISDANVNSLDKNTGFVIYRDRSFVECGYCKSFCKRTGVRAEIEIDQRKTAS